MHSTVWLCEDNPSRQVKRAAIWEFKGIYTIPDRFVNVMYTGSRLEICLTQALIQYHVLRRCGCHCQSTKKVTSWRAAQT